MGLDGDLDVTTAEARRAAALAYQLPPDSRVKRAIAPEAANSINTLLLREIEHNQRLWHWAHTDEAKNKETAPLPYDLPGEEAARERAEEEAQRSADAVAESLGIKL